MFDELTAWVLALADSPWSLVVLFGLIVVDGVFPPIPSETSVIALASLSHHTDTVTVPVIMLVAALGAFIGDLAAFGIGRLARTAPGGVGSLPLLRSDRAHRVIRWAEETLDRRGAAFLLAARYIPIARVVANLSAGALGFPVRRFLLVAGIGAVGWSIWVTCLGIGAGHLLAGQPLLGALVGAVAGLVIGTVVDKALSRSFGRAVVSETPD